MRNQTAFKLNQTTQHWYQRINRKRRRRTEREFPNARDFIRPGFDEITEHVM